jgi:hypothetical protein
MSDERYLIVSYFLTGCVCLLLGVVAFLWLRRPIGQIAGVRFRSLGEAIHRFFPASTLLIAVAAFASVSYYACGTRNYDQIVSDRPYIRSMERAQISASFEWLAWLAIFWGFVILLYLLAIRRRDSAEKTGCDAPQD